MSTLELDKASLAAAFRPGQSNHADGLVLIVDDDRHEQRLISSMVARLGYDYIIAENGEEGVAMFCQNRPDVVLMDYRMPRMDGKEATREIRSVCGDDQVPILFLTGIGDESVHAECVDLGADDIIVKPCASPLCEAKVHSAMQRSLLYKAVKNDRDTLKHFRSQYHEDIRIAQSIYASRTRYENQLRLENLAYSIEPVEVLNGDTILAAATPTGGQIIVLGDSTGHGLPAAVAAMVVIDVFYAMVAKGFALLEILREMNRKLNSTLPTGRFMAAGGIELDPTFTDATVWNGGLPPILIQSADGGVKGEVKSSHLPLGILPNDQLDLHPETLSLRRGDKLIAYSDGLVEAANEQGDLLGIDRVREAVDGLDATADCYDALTGLLKSHRGDAPQTDDVTLMLVTAAAPDIDETQTDAKSSFSRSPAQWSLAMEFGVDALRDNDPLPAVLTAVDNVQGLGDIRSPLFTILAELFTNALDHGLLGLDSELKASPDGFSKYYEAKAARLASLAQGTIRFELSHTPGENHGELIIVLENDGEAFDPTALLKGLEDNRDYSGRGIQLVKALTKTLAYSTDGRRAEACLKTYY